MPPQPSETQATTSDTRVRGTESGSSGDPFAPVTYEQGSRKIAKKEKAATDPACNCALLHETLGWLPHLFRCPVKPAFAIEIRQKTRPDGPVT